MTREEFLATQFPSLAAWIRTAAAAGSESWAHERDGIAAQVSPAVPDVSLFNSVTYRDAEALRAALPELATVYAAAGVRAWTVWIHESDAEATAVVRAAGHALDATPEGMGCSLEELIPPDRVHELQYTEDPNVEDLQVVLAHGYGFSLEASRRVAAAVPNGPGTVVGLARVTRAYSPSPPCRMLVVVDSPEVCNTSCCSERASSGRGRPPYRRPRAGARCTPHSDTDRSAR